MLAGCCQQPQESLGGFTVGQKVGGESQGTSTGSHTSGDVQARRLSWKEQAGDAEEDAVVGQYSVSRL